MAILQLRSRRKNTGGRYIRPLVKRLARMGGLPVFTKIAETKSKTLRVIGGNSKDKLLAVNKANVYDPKTNVNTKATTAGVEGSITFDYLFIPRFAGNYRIAPIKFSYL